ncbi:MAG: DegV family protein [Clostridia bacterium]|nr:DegV family protein [Clostridia bacterium]
MKERKFKIVTDSGCDMSAEYLLAKGIVKVSLSFTLDGRTYEGEEMATDEFYKALKNGGMPVTHQATPEKIKEALQPILEGGEDVLALAFSSGLSGTAGSYHIAAKDLRVQFPEREIIVVDSLCASMGQGLLVDYAVRFADEGKSIEETADYLEGLKGQIAHLFTVDNLYHLKRGGRVSGVTALIGTILKIKPVMHVDDNGKLVAVEKCMGRKKALQRLIERLEETQALAKGDPIFLSHGACQEDAAKIAEILREKYPDNPVTVGEIGPVIGSHSGIGTLAIFYRAKKR